MELAAVSMELAMLLLELALLLLELAMLRSKNTDHCLAIPPEPEILTSGIIILPELAEINALPGRYRPGKRLKLEAGLAVRD